ncbi:MAG: GNAT family N-acetyltransferase [Alphaproteobacteria bacterium]|nr:GNAT family N-acetyltransferase [Alphaproteobacteria bacterium]
MPGAPFAIVDVEEAQLPGIQAIFNQAVRDTFSIWSETETTLGQRRSWLEARRAGGFPVIAAVDPAHPARVLGYGSFGVFRDFPGYVKTVEHSVYVAPASQRMGVGRAILSELVDQARARNLERMVGGIDSSNDASLALHAAMGFERQGCLTGVGRKFGKSLDLVFVVKAL